MINDHALDNNRPSHLLNFEARTVDVRTDVKKNAQEFITTEKKCQSPR